MQRPSRVVVLVSVLALGLASPGVGIELDANILGVYTDTTFSQLDPDFFVTADGDQAIADLQPGQGVLVGLDVANVDLQTVVAIFVTLRVDGTRMNFLSSLSSSGVLLSPGFGGSSLPPVAPADVKINSPGGTDEWIHAMLHALQFGAFGPGPDVNAVQLFFEVLPSVGAGPIDFILDVTAGDGDGIVFAGAGPPLASSFNDAVLLVPEPEIFGALPFALGALLMAGRRRHAPRPG